MIVIKKALKKKSLVRVESAIGRRLCRVAHGNPRASVVVGETRGRTQFCENETHAHTPVVASPAHSDERDSVAWTWTLRRARVLRHPYMCTRRVCVLWVTCGFGTRGRPEGGGRLLRCRILSAGLVRVHGTNRRRESGLR